MPTTSARGTVRAASRTSPAAIGRLFHPSVAHSPASIAAPNDDAPQRAPPAPSRLQSPGAPANTSAASPTTSTILSPVMIDCTRPPNATVRQLTTVNTAMNASASALCSSSPAIGTSPPANTDAPTAYDAIDPGVPIQKRVHPYRKPIGGPHASRR